MAKLFELYWVRETGGDAGKLVPAAELDGTIRARVLALAGDDPAAVLRLQLPFLDQRGWRRRSEVLRGIKLVREGDLIRNVPANPAAAIRDRAALLLALDPAWRGLPAERDSEYCGVWHRVSLALQKYLKCEIARHYFADISRFDDRRRAFTMLIYQVSRPFHGRGRTEYTYDAADFVSCQRAWWKIGAPLQEKLAGVQQRLTQAGKNELARRYAPIWSEDIQRFVQENPRPFMDLIAKESLFINAVLELGTSRKLSAVKPFSKMASSTLRNVMGLDMRDLGLPALEQATAALAASRAAPVKPSDAGDA